ncbi:MAG: MogA/MoaB family molybdenum cofactor biosynthesis protein [Candidatus Ranarchaeia archaeon]
MNVPSIHKKGGKKEGTFFFILLSDSRSENKANLPEDKTTPLVKTILSNNNHILIDSIIIPDNKTEIQSNIKRIIDTVKPQFIITSGGTGITDKDITPESIKPLLDKEIPGFGELFRYLSYKEVGSSALFSRAFAGVLGKTVIFSLPGSPNAVKMAIELLILPEVSHFDKMVS